MNIVGISGTNGSGKDTVGHMLAERLGFLFIPATELLREEARTTGRDTSRKTLAEISTAWRRKYGMGAVVDVALERNKDRLKEYGGVAISSLRHPGEADRIHELGGVVVWVDADPKVRYERVQANAAARGRVDEDKKTFEQFLAEEQAEMLHSGDEATLNMSAVRDRADITVMNNGDDEEAFKDASDKAISPLLTTSS